jgi:hypothetical protein
MLRSIRSRAGLVTTALLAASCGGSANVAGNFSVNLTNKDNGCNFANWTVGQMTTGVPVTITQSGSDVTATITGAAGAFVTLVFGSAVFTGKVDGATLDLTLYGTRSVTMGNCTYTVNGELKGSIVGDVLDGTIDYKSATNGSPDCGAIQDCQSEQAFNGTRPPS